MARRVALVLAGISLTLFAKLPAHAQNRGDSGSIVGYGTTPGAQTHAFVLTPVPEPGSLALLGVGAAVVLAYQKRLGQPE